ncbi:leucyl/phenylalanyl-tRNA--protein transferase [Rosenbergiella nectarea]|uniref:Leucyl/phenylalanyl-tRNA--protein transferase n=1 Tax=Rosenbergiella nectarea TaxID=988801 RepID=A0A1H9HBR9_9GAMM|nr:leucyl/phenylalanyl-tRNA--protein transferase [Rosenbergiella nectarea]SEQ59707.1 leucyl/phenylalanyl-tRNA--protein transferase [Rosenbergiella nectarea]
MSAIYLPCLEGQPNGQFPSPDCALASPQGLLAYGGDLLPGRLIAAYQQGIFPWFSEEDPILWWSPDPRAVLPIDAFHLSRSMQRFLRHCPYHVTLNHNFRAVIEGCASTHFDGTWITEEVITAWCNLAAMGHAHSLEVWCENELVGGIYGMALGGIFCGESMFSRQPNASKLALFQLCHHFSAYGGELIDCQILNPHTHSLGAREISRQQFLTQLADLQKRIIPSECWAKKRLF